MDKGGVRRKWVDRGDVRSGRWVDRLMKGSWVDRGDVRRSVDRGDVRKRWMDSGVVRGELYG